MPLLNIGRRAGERLSSAGSEPSVLRLDQRRCAALRARESQQLRKLPRFAVTPVPVPSFSPLPAVDSPAVPRARSHRSVGGACLTTCLGRSRPELGPSRCCLLFAARRAQPWRASSAPARASASGRVACSCSHTSGRAHGRAAGLADPLRATLGAGGRLPRRQGPHRAPRGRLARTSGSPIASPALDNAFRSREECGTVRARRACRERRVGPRPQPATVTGQGGASFPGGQGGDVRRLGCAALEGGTKGEGIRAAAAATRHLARGIQDARAQGGALALVIPVTTCSWAS